MVKPSAFAVCELTVNSNVVGSCTGGSAASRLSKSRQCRLRLAGSGPHSSFHRTSNRQLPHVHGAKVRYWHNAHIEQMSSNVRFGGLSRHHNSMAPCPLMTESGHVAACMSRRPSLGQCGNIGKLFSQGATRGPLTGDASGAWSGTMLTVSAHLHISALRFDSAIL